MTILHRRPLLYGVLALLVALTLVSMGRALQFTFLSPLGGIDFHSYWYAGLFVRQGHDPYWAYLTRQTPDLPIAFLGGYVQEAGLERGQTLATTPANTAPIVLLLTVFSWLPWPVAKTVWFVINCVFVALLPWLLMRLLPDSRRLPNLLMFIYCFTFWSLKGTRAALGTGQTTLLVFVLMVLCLLLWKRNWLGAGLCLGVALSKYSVALPVLLYALYQRKWRVVVVAGVVQLCGIGLIASLGAQSPLSLLQTYRILMLRHVNAPGIHLATLFAPDSAAQWLAPLLFTCAVGGYFIWMWYTNRLPQREHLRFAQMHLLTGLVLWTLLVAYHRPYDGVLILFFVALLFFGLQQPEDWSLSLWQRRGLALFLAFAVGILTLPYEQIGSLWPGEQTEMLLGLIEQGVTVTLIAMLVVTLWLLPRATQNERRAHE